MQTSETLVRLTPDSVEAARAARASVVNPYTAELMSAAGVEFTTISAVWRRKAQESAPGSAGRNFATEQSNAWARLANQMADTARAYRQRAGVPTITDSALL